MTDGSVQVEVLTEQRMAGAIRPQRRVLPGRPAFWIHPVLFPGLVAIVAWLLSQCAARSRGASSIFLALRRVRRRRCCCVLAVYLERRRRPDRQPLSA